MASTHWIVRRLLTNRESAKWELIYAAAQTRNSVTECRAGSNLIVKEVTSITARITTVVGKDGGQIENPGKPSGELPAAGKTL